MCTTEKTAGRPRDAQASDKLKRTALRLVRDQGYGAVSVSAIIGAAQVSRQTLYNRWATKAELVLEALYDDVFQMVAAPVPCPTCRDALLRFLSEIFDHLAADGDTLRSLIGAAQDDPAFRDIFRDRFVSPREHIVTRLLTQAQAAGELPPGQDAEMLSVFIHGAFWYRLLNGQDLGKAWAQRIVDGVFGPSTAAEPSPQPPETEPEVSPAPGKAARPGRGSRRPGARGRFARKRRWGYRRAGTSSPRSAARRGTGHPPDGARWKSCNPRGTRRGCGRTPGKA